MASINNIDDLKAKIYHLKVKEDQQKYALRQRFSSPSKIFFSLKSLFSSSANERMKVNSTRKKDYFAILSRVILPITLKRTIFKKSNFMVKSLVNVASKRAAKFITEDSVMSLWNKIKSVLPERTGTNSSTTMSSGKLRILK